MLRYFDKIYGLFVMGICTNKASAGVPRSAGAGGANPLRGILLILKGIVTPTGRQVPSDAALFCSLGAG